MSVAIMARVWERAIETTPKMILLKLADHANDDGGSIFPGVDTVRMAAGVASDSTIKRRMRQFKALGILVEDDGDDDAAPRTAPKTGRGHRKVWRIDLEALAAAFPVVREGVQPVSLTELVKAVRGGEERGPESPPLEASERGAGEPGKGGSQDHKGGPDIAPEPSKNHQEPPRARGGDPDGPPREPGDQPPDAPAGPKAGPKGRVEDPPEPEDDPDTPVYENRHWKPARQHFVQRRSEPEAKAWWDPLIPLRHDDDGTLVIDAPSAWHVQQLNARYSLTMEWALQQEGGAGLRFVVEGLAAKAEASRKAQAKMAGKAGAKAEGQVAKRRAGSGAS